MSSRNKSDQDSCSLTRISVLVAQFAHQVYPGFRSAKLRIVLQDGEVATFPISYTLLVTAEKPTLETPTGALDSSIVEALQEVPSDALPTGEELAKMAGYPYNGRFREALGRLTRSKHIKNHQPGYALAK